MLHLLCMFQTSIPTNCPKSTILFLRSVAGLLEKEKGNAPCVTFPGVQLGLAPVSLGTSRHLCRPKNSDRQAIGSYCREHPLEGHLARNCNPSRTKTYARKKTWKNHMRDAICAKAKFQGSRYKNAVLSKKRHMNQEMLIFCWTVEHSAKYNFRIH